MKNIAPEQRALPVLHTMSPRLREPTPEGSVGMRRPLAQPTYVPPAVETRPHADEIAHWLDVLEATPFLELAGRADASRRQKHPDGVVSYIVDRNINYTNTCITDCKFCAFYRRPKDEEGYVLSYAEIGAKIDETKALPDLFFGGNDLIPVPSLPGRLEQYCSSRTGDPGQDPFCSGWGSNSA